MLVIHDSSNIDPAEAEDIYAEKSCRENEHEEGSVVPQSYALANPRAMMVKSFDTVVAY